MEAVIEKTRLSGVIFLLARSAADAVNKASCRSKPKWPSLVDSFVEVKEENFRCKRFLTLNVRESIM